MLAAVAVPWSPRELVVVEALEDEVDVVGALRAARKVHHLVGSTDLGRLTPSHSITEARRNA